MHRNFCKKLVRAAEPLAQNLEKFGPSGWIPFEERQDVATIKDGQRAASVRYGIGGSRLAIKDRQLAEYLALRQNRQQELFSVGRGHADAYGSPQDSHHILAGGSDRENRLARSE
jgi:hypothetical protein